MHTTIKRANRPNRTQPTQHERPPRGPRRQIRRLPKDIAHRISRARFSYGERDDGRDDEGEVHDHEDGLEFPHYAGEGRSKDAVAENGAEEDEVDGAVGGGPGAIARDHDHAEEHEGEAVVDAAEAADEAEGVAVADEEGEGVAG